MLTEVLRLDDLRVRRAEYACQSRYPDLFPDNAFVPGLRPAITSLPNLGRGDVAATVAGATWTPYGLSFGAAAGQGITIPKPKAGGDQSLLLVVSFDTDSATYCIASNSGATSFQWLFVGATSTLTFNHTSDSNGASWTPTVGEFYAILARTSPATAQNFMRMSIDGASLINQAGDAYGTIDAPLIVGRLDGDLLHHAGDVAAVAWWDRALSDSEAQLIGREPLCWMEKL